AGQSTTLQEFVLWASPSPFLSKLCDLIVRLIPSCILLKPYIKYRADSPKYQRGLLMNIQKSIELFQQAQALIPGGVDSPVRAFRAVGGQPLFIDHGQGPYLYDVDGNRFIDYVLSWGPLILGHSRKEVIVALQKAAEKGTSFGAPS